MNLSSGHTPDSVGSSESDLQGSFQTTPFKEGTYMCTTPELKGTQSQPRVHTRDISWSYSRGDGTCTVFHTCIHHVHCCHGVARGKREELG